MRRSPDIEQLVASWFAAATRGDTALVDARVTQSDHARLIGSDPDEEFSGGAAVAEFLKGEVVHADGKAIFTPEEVEAFEEGTAGWATAHVRITLPDGQHVTPRWSSVFVNEGGIWRFVQTHASFGVRNDAVGWIYPT